MSSPRPFTGWPGPNLPVIIIYNLSSVCMGDSQGWNPIGKVLVKKCGFNGWNCHVFMSRMEYMYILQSNFIDPWWFYSEKDWYRDGAQSKILAGLIIVIFSSANGWTSNITRSNLEDVTFRLSAGPYVMFDLDVHRFYTGDTLVPSGWYPSIQGVVQCSWYKSFPSFQDRKWSRFYRIY